LLLLRRNVLRSLQGLPAIGIVVVARSQISATLPSLTGALPGESVDENRRERIIVNLWVLKSLRRRGDVIAVRGAGHVLNALQEGGRITGVVRNIRNIIDSIINLATTWLINGLLECRPLLGGRPGRS